MEIIIRITKFMRQCELYLKKNNFRTFIVILLVEAYSVMWNMYLIMANYISCQFKHELSVLENRCILDLLILFEENRPIN